MPGASLCCAGSGRAGVCVVTGKGGTASARKGVAGLSTH